MSTDTMRAPLQPGEPAPDFALPAVHQDGILKLSDYRGRGAVLLAIFRGLFCPFCRRALAQLLPLDAPDRAVEPLAVVATDLDNARLYFKLRPSKIAIVADPDCTTHRAFGVPEPVLDAPLLQALQATRINPTGELPEALPVTEAGHVLNRIDGYQETPSDLRDREQHGVQLKGQFLLDRDGVVRWVNIEGAREGLPGLGKFPGEAELMEAVRALA